ncbi:MAG: dihydrolipoamide acetyltransferase family protein [Gammaproteobacteria bacterium]|nr:dihydrolipoamide acetyltransferase family protein [Gammaproteobacteria bacterium]
MAVRLRLAALGHTMERGKVVEWYVSEGGTVVEGTPLFAVETDKAVVDVEAPAGGVLLRIDAPVNREYPVGATLAWIGDAGEALPDQTDETVAAPQAVSGEQRVTPVARRLAERHGVDADRLGGTGPGGRVTKDDVKRAIDAGTAPALEQKASGEPASESRASGEPPHDVIPLKGIRRVTAERLSAHWTGAPQVTEGVDIDMTEVRAFRAAHRDEWRSKFGIMPSLNDIVLKAIAIALEAHPTLNSALVDGAIHRYREINLGVAVDVEDGLVVPVLRNAGRLDLGGIASAVADLAARAKAGKLTLADLEGATFTVSNLSALGVDWFTPVLNPPQCALLGVGRMRRTPAAVGREVLIRDIATFVLTFDHRALDGAPAGRFLARLKRVLEAPGSTLISGCGALK